MNLFHLFRNLNVNNYFEIRIYAKRKKYILIIFANFEYKKRVVYFNYSLILGFNRLNVDCRQSYAHPCN